MVADLPDFFLVTLKPLNDGVLVEVVEHDLTFLGTEYDELVSWQDAHAEHVLLFQALLALHLEFVLLRIHE